MYSLSCSAVYFLWTWGNFAESQGGGGGCGVESLGPPDVWTQLSPVTLVTTGLRCLCRALRLSGELHREGECTHTAERKREKSLSSGLTEMVECFMKCFVISLRKPKSLNAWPAEFCLNSRWKSNLDLQKCPDLMNSFSLGLKDLDGYFHSAVSSLNKNHHACCLSEFITPRGPLAELNMP